ncbi:MAG: universal stress protein [Pirellulales bacterium]
MSWLRKKKVLVPIDFSEESLAAVDTALELVADASHLHVVYVLPNVEMVEPELIWTDVDHDARRHHAELALRERLPGAKYAALKMEVAFGDPGQQIAEAAQRAAAELIVLPSHGRTGLSRLLIGSTAERVVRLAHCPVLVLKK